MYDNGIQSGSMNFVSNCFFSFLLMNLQTNKKGGKVVSGIPLGLCATFGNASMLASRNLMEKKNNYIDKKIVECTTNKHFCKDAT